MGNRGASTKLVNDDDMDQKPKPLSFLHGEQGKCCPIQLDLTTLKFFVIVSTEGLGMSEAGRKTAPRIRTYDFCVIS